MKSFHACVLCLRCRWGEKHAKLSAALGRLLDDYSLVKFFPLDITNEENVVDLLTVVSIFIKGMWIICFEL